MTFSIIPLNWCSRDPWSKSDFYEEYPHQTESLRHLYENNNTSCYHRDEDDNRNYNNINNDNNNTNNNYDDDNNKNNDSNNNNNNNCNNNNEVNNNDYPPHHGNDPDNHINQAYDNPQPQCFSELSPHTQPSSTSMRHQHMHNFDLSRDNERDDHQNDVGIDDDDAFDRERYHANQLLKSETDDPANPAYPANPANDHIPVRC